MIALYIIGILLWIVVINAIASYKKTSGIEILTAVAPLWPIALSIILLRALGKKLGTYIKELK